MLGIHNPSLGTSVLTLPKDYAMAGPGLGVRTEERPVSEAGSLREVGAAPFLLPSCSFSGLAWGYSLPTVLSLIWEILRVLG